MVGYEQKPSNLPCDGYREPGWTPGNWLAHPGTGHWVTSLYQVTELPGDAFRGAQGVMCGREDTDLFRLKCI